MIVVESGMIEINPELTVGAMFRRNAEQLGLELSFDLVGQTGTPWNVYRQDVLLYGSYGLTSLVDYLQGYADALGLK